MLLRQLTFCGGLLAACALFLSLRPAKNSNELFPFMEHNRWGYLDAQGRVHIAPRFLGAQPFAEGLAPAREGGCFGYIDTSGKFIIAPTFDYAMPFENGYATVWSNGKQALIDRSGHVQFEPRYASWGAAARPQSLIVATASRRQGLIDLQGKLLADTIYAKITPAGESLAVVEPFIPNSDADRPHEQLVGIIDQQGRTVVPYGRFSSISRFQEGLALVKIPSKTDDEDDTEAFINTRGAVVLTIPAAVMQLPYDGQGFSHGAVAVEVYTGGQPTDRPYDRPTFAGLLDKKGKLLFRNEQLEQLIPVAANRALAKTKDDTWQLLDFHGRVLSQEPYEDVYFESQRESTTGASADGLIFVKTQRGLAVVDTDGRYQAPPRTLDFSYSQVIRSGNLFLFMADLSTTNAGYAYRYGFWNPLNGTLVKPRFQELAPVSYSSAGLLAALDNGRTAYLNASGKMVWQQSGRSQPQRPNIDFMSRATYTAASPRVAKYANLGGWGGSRNAARKVPAEQANDGQLRVHVDATSSATYAGSYQGYSLSIVNGSRDTVLFDAQDSRLYLNLQARNMRGEWQDIEYVPSSWCGNSYHTLFLAPQHRWQVVVPAYDGEFKTKLRAKLLRKNPHRDDKPIAVYSNEFDGGVNPAQFWRKREYQPQDIMDPYRD